MLFFLRKVVFLLIELLIKEIDCYYLKKTICCMMDSLPNKEQSALMLVQVLDFEQKLVVNYPLLDL